MLTIYTSVKKAKEFSNLDIVQDIDAKFGLKLNKITQDTLYKDAYSTMVLTEIEGMTARHANGYIDGKFGPVHLSNISTGGKGLLLAINYRDKSIVNIDELGYNCVYLLFELSKHMNISVISTAVLGHMKKEFEAIVNNKRCTGYNITLEMGNVIND